MKKKIQTIAILLFPLYLATVLLTNVSLTGFWTDVLCSLLFSILSIVILLKNGADFSIVLKIISFACSAIVIGLFLINLLNPFTLSTLKLRSFYFQSVNGRLFNAYFKPVGSYSGGYGNFWITQSPKYFPIIEWQVYYDRTVQYDFNDDTFEGRPTNNYEVVRNYIQDEVIDKNR